MLILGKDQLKDPSLGYARTFVRQVEDCLGLALEKRREDRRQRRRPQPGRARRPAARGRPRARPRPGDRPRRGRRRAPRSALGWEGALTANAYLGGFGIAAALRAGADVVVTGRVTDASLVVGPAVAHHGWDADVVRRAGRRGRRRPRPRVRDPGDRRQLQRLPRPARTATGRSASRSPRSPPTARASSPSTTAPAARSPSTPSPPSWSTRSSRRATSAPTSPRTSTPSGSRRRARTGSRSPASAARPRPRSSRSASTSSAAGATASSSCSPASTSRPRRRGCASSSAPRSTGRPRSTWSDGRRCRPLDADTEEAASALLRCTVKDASPDPVGRAFTAAAVELALGVLPRLHDDRAARRRPRRSASTAPAYVDRAAVDPHRRARRRHGGGRRGPDGVHAPQPSRHRHRARRRTPRATDVLTRRLPLGTFVHARSGDKGGDANLGLWVAHDGADQATYDARVEWLSKLITAARVRELRARGGRPRRRGVPAAQPRRGQRRHPRAARRRASPRRTRFDPQAKGLGEWVRSRHVSIEDESAVTDRRASARRCARPRASSSAARSRRTSRSGRTPARSRARCTRSRRRRRACSASPSPRRSAARAATSLDCGRAAGGVLRGRRLQRPDGGALHRRHRAAAHRGQRQRRPDRPLRPARRWPARLIGSLAITEPGGGSDVAGITTRGGARRRPLRRQRRQDLHHLRRPRRLRHHRGPHRRPGPRRRLACSSSRRARPASPSTASLTEDGLALLRHRRAVVRRRAGPRRQPGRRRRTRASTRSPTSSWSSGSRSRSTPTASPPARSTLTAAYCRERETFGKPLIANQVCGTSSSRCTGRSRSRAPTRTTSSRATSPASP